MSKVGVIGKGTVGSAVYEGLLSIGNDVSFFDPAFPESKFEDILDTECVFISVPTDQDANGDCDVTIVNKVVAELYDAGYTGLISIKSTVVPGTSVRLQEGYPTLRLSSTPEFLRAKTALADFIYNHDVLVVGTFNEEDAELIERIHGSLPKSVSRVHPTEAEVIKYFNNVHHSVSVIFANIAFEVCQKLGVDYDNVYETIIKRECFNPAYLRCNQNVRGFGGHCLPKDTSAWNNLLKKLGLEFELIQATLNDNKRI